MIYFPQPWVTGTKKGDLSLYKSTENKYRREKNRRSSQQTSRNKSALHNYVGNKSALHNYVGSKKYQRVPFHNCASRQELSPSASFITALLIAPSTSARPDYKRTQDYEYKYKRRRQRKPSQKSIIIFSNASSFNHAYASTIANRMSYA